MVRAVLWLVLFSLGSQLPALAKRKETPSLPVRAQVQLERARQNYLFVPATVNGRSATFLLDTGEDICFVQKGRAAALGVIPSRRQVRSGGRWFEAGELPSISIGGVSFPGVQVGLCDPAQFRGPIPGKNGKQADGIISLQFLRSYHAIINCRTQTLYLQNGSGPAIDLRATTRGLGFTQVPLSIDSDGSLSAPCTLKGKSGTLAVDTGAFVTIFDEAAVRDMGLKETETKQTVRTPSGKVKSLRLAQVDDLRIGGVPIAPQPFAVSDLFVPIKPVRAFLGINTIQTYDQDLVRAKREVLGLLGDELLYQRSAIIDLGRMALYLK